MPELTNDEQDSDGAASLTATFGNIVAVTIHSAEVHLYTVTEEQLDNLASGRWLIYTNLASGFFGCFVSLASIFLAGFTSPSPIHTAITSGATMATGFLWALFTVMAVAGYRAHRRNVRQIKERRYQG